MTHTIPFTSFPSDIYVDRLGRAVKGTPQFALSVLGDEGRRIRISKQAVVTGDNRCLDYHWSYWAELVGQDNEVRHYRLKNTELAPSGKIPFS